MIFIYLFFYALGFGTGFVFAILLVQERRKRLDAAREKGDD